MTKDPPPPRANNTQEPPPEFICPLTKELFSDPVMSRYGTSFERKAILEWLDEGNEFCPVTAKPLRPSCLVSNKNLEWKIRCWRHEHGLAAPDHDEPDFVHHFSGFVAVPPKRFLCPITKKLMVDPMMTRDGHHYERTAILKYIEENNYTCPETGKPLHAHNLVPDSHLQWEIHHWHENNGDEDEPLPTVYPSDIVDPHNAEHQHHRPPSPEALVGVRGDPALEHMRRDHMAHDLKEKGYSEKDAILEPFCSTSAVDHEHDTLETLNHVF